MESIAEFGWVAATVSPWTVSPHPNFSESSLSRYRALALVTEGRFSDLDKYEEKQSSSDPDWAPELVRLARGSLFYPGHEATFGPLWALSDEPALPVGARAASALYASVLASDLEKPTVAVEKLEALVDSVAFSPEDEDQTQSATNRLIQAQLVLQLAVRWHEVGEDGRAAEELKRLVQILPSQRSEGFEDFQVSKGIGWTSKRVQLDVLQAVKKSALRLRSRIEDLDGETWVQLVRSKPTWKDARLGFTTAYRDAEILDRQLEAKTKSLSRTIRVGSTPNGVILALSSLLISELSGDISQILASRTEFARLNLLRRTEDLSVQEMCETIKLSRRSNSKPMLDSALLLARSEWPAEAIRLACLDILSRPTFPQRLPEADRRTLSAGSDVLTMQERASVIRAVIPLWKLDIEHLAADRDVGLIRLITEMTPESGDDDFVAQYALKMLDAHGGDYQINQAVSSLFAAVDWAKVNARTSASWAFWGRSNLDGEKNRSLATTIIRELAPDYLLSMTETLDASEKSLEYVLAEAGTPLSQKLEEQAIRHAVDTFERAQNQGPVTYRTIGGVNAPEVAAAVAIRAGNPALWVRLGEYLSDRRLPSSDKSLTMDRLANDSHELPLTLLGDLANTLPEIAREGVTGRLFAEETLPWSGPALRLIGKMGIGSPDFLMAAVLELAGSSSPSARAEAAATLPFSIGVGGDATWAQVLLVQLATDDDPVVKGTAAEALARSLGWMGSAQALVQSKLIQLLHERSIRTPLKALHGLQRANTRAIDIPAPIREAAGRVSEDHASWIVRRAAAHALGFDRRDEAPRS